MVSSNFKVVSKKKNGNFVLNSLIMCMCERVNCSYQCHCSGTTVKKLCIDISEVLLIYGQQQSTRLKLPAGPPESDSWLNLNVHIADSYGTSRIYPLSIQVSNYKR